MELTWTAFARCYFEQPMFDQKTLGKGPPPRTLLSNLDSSASGGGEYQLLAAFSVWEGSTLS